MYVLHDLFEDVTWLIDVWAMTLTYFWHDSSICRGCQESTNILENTRTMETNWLIRQMAWQMPYHLEHHGVCAVCMCLSTSSIKGKCIWSFSLSLFLSLFVSFVCLRPPRVSRFMMYVCESRHFDHHMFCVSALCTCVCWLCLLYIFLYESWAALNSLFLSAACKCFSYHLEYHGFRVCVHHNFIVIVLKSVRVSWNMIVCLQCFASFFSRALLCVCVWLSLSDNLEFYVRLRFLLAPALVIVCICMCVVWVSDHIYFQCFGACVCMHCQL